MLQLRCRIDGSVRVFPLVGDRVRIGRGPENEIRLPDPSVSRHHALIERSPQGWVIRDLGSTNGTRQNGTRVQRSHLAAGDDLRIGSFDLEAEEVTEGGTSVHHPIPFPPPDPGRPTPPVTKPDDGHRNRVLAEHAAHRLRDGRSGRRERRGRPADRPVAL
jgi:predicted component of type VI protein secretion system